MPTVMKAMQGMKAMKKGRSGNDQRRRRLIMLTSAKQEYDQRGLKQLGDCYGGVAAHYRQKVSGATKRLKKATRPPVSTNVGAKPKSVPQRKLKKTFMKIGNAPHAKLSEVVEEHRGGTINTDERVLIEEHRGGTITTDERVLIGGHRGGTLNTEDRVPTEEDRGGTNTEARVPAEDRICTVSSDNTGL